MIEFFRMMAGAKDVVIARTIPAWKAAEPLPKPHDFEKFADEGYRKNVLIYACIRTLADCVAKAPPVVKTDPEGEVIEEGPMVDLLWEPNPTDTRFSLVERIVMHLNVAGNAYVWKRRAKNRKVGELYALRPDRVSIKVKKSGDLDGYVYKLDADSKSEFLPANDVIHMLLPDPLDDFYGLSPIAVMARYGDLDTQAVDYLRAFFLNGGAPAGLLKLKNRAPAAERARIQAQWKEMYGTHTGWHDIAVLDAEAEYEELGSRPEKLTMTAMFDTTETRICSAFGVPPIVVQVRVGLENNVWGNYKEAVKSMWNETVIPQYDRIGDALTRGLVGDELGEGIEIAFDYSKVDALQEDQDSKRKFALEGWDKGLITLNEARETAGLDPIKGEEGGERKKAPDPVAPGPFDAKTGQPLPKPGEKQGIEIDAEDLDEYLGTGKLRLHRPKAQGLPETSGGPVETLRGKSDEPLWRAFRGQISKQEDVMVDRFVRLIAASRRQMNVNAVARKVRDGEEATMKAMELAETLRAMSILSGESIHDAHGVGGAIAARHLSLLLQLGDAPKETFAFKFDAADPRAAKWISERKKWLADRFGEDSHEAVSGILQQSFTDGVGPLATAKRLRQHLGLTAQDSGALLKLEGKLAARGLSAAAVQKRLAGESSKMIRRRAVTIARTEIVKATHEGQRELYLQAVDNRLLNEDVAVLEWIVTLDDLLCPTCIPLDGTTSPLKGQFPGGYGSPPAHPRCRCTTAIRPFGKGKKERKRTVTDPTGGQKAIEPTPKGLWDGLKVGSKEDPRLVGRELVRLGADGKERSILLDGKNRFLGKAVGDAQSVDLPKGLASLVSDPKQKIRLHHNHPENVAFYGKNGATLSQTDVRSLANNHLAGIEEVLAHTQRRTYAVRRGVKWGNADDARRKIDKAFQPRFFAVQDRMLDAVGTRAERKILSESLRQQATLEALAELDQAGVIRYAVTNH